MERLLPGFVTRGVSRQKMAEDANAPAFSDNRILSDPECQPPKKGGSLEEEGGGFLTALISFQSKSTLWCTPDSYVSQNI